MSQPLANTALCISSRMCNKNPVRHSSPREVRIGIVHWANNGGKPVSNNFHGSLELDSSTSDPFKVNIIIYSTNSPALWIGTVCGTTYSALGLNTLSDRDAHNACFKKLIAKADFLIAVLRVLSRRSYDFMYSVKYFPSSTQGTHRYA